MRTIKFKAKCLDNQEWPCVSSTDTDNTPYYSYNMIKLQYISWIRDQSGHVISRPVRQIANTITTFAGRNGFIDPRDGLPNTTPHIIHTFQ